jgi:hypothetical protein
VTDDFASIYAASDYRVRLSRGGYATIRIDQPLPIRLRTLVDARAWGFITAWNPQGLQCDRHANRFAQRRMVDELRELPSTVAILPAIGVGGDWSEPSLFVIGPDATQLDALAARYRQLAWIHGNADGIASLRWTPP